MILWLLSLIFTVTLTLNLRRVYTKFSSCGVKTPRTFPIVGNMYRLLTRQKHFVDDLEELYFKFPEERFVGRYEFLNPMIVANDLELIKKITIKDYDHFLDHRTVIDEKTEPIFARNLFSLKGQEWKDMRTTLNSAFTSAKIKLMVPFMVEAGEQMLNVLDQKIEDSGGYMDVDVKDLATRYATDVVASCAFGLKVDSHKEENNTFYEMGKSVATIKFKHLLIFIFYPSFPTIVKRLNFTIFKEAAKKFFTNLVLDTMSEREAKKIIRSDMIHLLMQAKKGQLLIEDQLSETISKGASFSAVNESAVSKKTQCKVWSDNDLVAQAVLFFIAGFETSSSAMCFAIHEIAMNPDVQKRLVQEIKEFDRMNNGKIDYSSIQSMTYLDMIVSECLRLWPPTPTMDRVCVKDYNIGRPNEKATRDYIIRKGEGVSIPIWAIHHDPKYFSDPMKFDPERFSEENKQKIDPLTYMPFGLGPRNCIGLRFAQYELKVFLYQILLRMEVFPSTKLRTPVTLAKGSFTISIDGGHWVGFRKRVHC